MATLRQAVEASRERGSLPQGGAVSLLALLRQFRPNPRGSTRALINAMYEPIGLFQSWAVILCRFKGDPPHPAEPAVEALYRRMFTPGTGGLVEFWRDASLGHVDISKSRIFGWVEVDIPRANAGGFPGSTPPGPGRVGMVDAGIRAVLAQDPRALDGMAGQITVYNENWSSDTVPANQQFAGSPFWIDGSASGNKTNLTPPHAPQITAHEMGHGFNMSHDVSADGTVHYADPCCVMSQSPRFTPPGWNVEFCAPLCLPHLVQHNWMYKHRLLDVGIDWLAAPNGFDVRLGQISDPGANASLGARLVMVAGDDEFDYHLEYVRPTGWARGLSGDSVFIRRIRSSDAGPTSAILGTIAVPAGGASADFVEPIGNVRFTVRWADATGRVVNVNAIKQRTLSSPFAKAKLDKRRLSDPLGKRFTRLQRP